MEYTVNASHLTEMGPPHIVLVGCGGTGSLVAEGLCRMMSGNFRLSLIDPDRVEEHNLLRQAFYPGDVGRFKAEALGRRLALQYRMPVQYCNRSYDLDLFREHSLIGYTIAPMRLLIIGAVDNAMARQSIARKLPTYSWWIDAGNGKNFGQVFVGNTLDRNTLRESFDDFDHSAENLPAPSLQQPSLLFPVPEPVRPVDCAQAVEDGQNPLINQAMAMLVLESTRLLLAGRLKWMQAYIDLDVGTLKYVWATPETVAKMLSMKKRYLMRAGCHRRERGGRGR